jgi:hypothetical protein
MNGRVLPGPRVRAMALAVLLLACPSGVSAQTIADPTTIEFNASPDHSTVSDGFALVDGYILKVYPNGGTTAVQTVSLGKPSPDAAGLIRIAFPASLRSALTPGVVYESRVAATGPGGSTESTDSNAFTISAPTVCAPAIASASTSVPATGGNGTIGVTAATGCAWTARSNVSWIAVTAGASGSGDGAVSFTATANTATTARTGTLTVAGWTFTVSQAGATPACSYAISPANRSITSAATAGSVAVTAGAGCAWSAASNASWISVTAGGSGSGAGSVSYAVDENTGTASRTGTVTVQGNTFTVTQAGATPACSYAISPANRSITSAATAGSVAVTAGAGCAWSAASNASWISVTAGASGTGNGSVTYSAAANTATTTRSGTVTIGGRTFSVTQAGATATCSFAVSPTSLSIPAAGGTASVSVTAAAGCTWTSTESVSWMSGGGSGSGNGTISFTIAANTGTVVRSTQVVVGGRTIVVTQAAPTACSFAVSPTSLSIPAAGGTASVSVTAAAGCTWTSTESVSWMSGGGSGSGNGTISFTVAANTGTVVRSTQVVVGGRTIVVTQAAATGPPTAPANLRIVVGGGQ